MKKVLFKSTILICLLGCIKDVESYVYYNNAEETSVKPEKPSYHIPEVKTKDEFSNIIYFDPDYSGGDSDGTIDKPYTNFNDQYSNRIPANTAFLFKRGTEHPRIGRLGPDKSWLVLYNMVWNNNYIGAYGEGKMPIIEGIWIIGYTAGQSPPGTRSNGVTIRDIHLYAESQWGWTWDNIVHLHDGPANVTIAYCILEGKHNPSYSWPSIEQGNGPHPYPLCGIRATGNGLTVFNNIIFNLGHDGIDLKSVL